MSEQTGAARSFSDEMEDQGRARRSQPTTWRRFRRHRVAFVGLAILGLLSFAAVFAPYIARHHPLYVNLDKVTLSPRWEHKLGTDEAGRDLFARLIFGGRVSLSVGLVSAAITTAIGTVIGLVSGYAGRKVDNVLMRFTELVMTFPAFFLILILIALIGREHLQHHVRDRAVWLARACTASPGAGALYQGDGLRGCGSRIGRKRQACRLRAHHARDPWLRGGGGHADDCGGHHHGDIAQLHRVRDQAAHTVLGQYDDCRAGASHAEARALDMGASGRRDLGDGDRPSTSWAMG